MNRVMNFPERSLELTSAFRQKWFWMWVLLPIVAYYASWLMMTLPFPIFLVIAQWWALDHNKRKENPKIWLWNLVVLGLTGLLLFGIHSRFSMDDDQRISTFNRISFWLFFGVYYGLQMINEIMLSKLFVKWRFGYWSIANLIAGLFWIGALTLADNSFNHVSMFEYFVWAFIPIMGIISNIITGLGIHLATQSRYGI